MRNTLMALLGCLAIAAVAALLGVYLVVSTPRTLHVGERAAYLAGEAPLLPVPFLIFCACWMPLAGLVLGLGIWTAERTGRQLAAEQLV